MNILYISYDGITDPIGQSQIAPYLRELSIKGAKFKVLTFEKKIYFDSTPEVFSKNINWKKLRYHKNPPILSTCYDIIRGTLIGIIILLNKKIKIVHARGYVSAAIAIILKRIYRLKLIFDMRGMWAEEKVDGGIWKKEGLLYKITKYYEKIFFLNADNIIVLTNSSRNLLNESLHVRSKSVDVIPTCTDINQFLPVNPLLIRKQLGLNKKFITMYIGSLGTFYGLREMIDFFSILSHHIDNPFFFMITNNPSSSIHEIMRFKHISKKDYKIKYIPYKKLKDVLPIANVSLMFYKRFLSKTGCCPTKFGESLACGLPVIINAGIGDTEKIIRKERVGVVVDEFSETAYNKAAEKMMQLLSEEDALKHRCRAVAEKYFSLAEGAEKYWRIYQKLFNT